MAQRVVDKIIVVVAGIDEAADAGALESGLGDVEPAQSRLQHSAVHQLLTLGGIGLTQPVLFLVHADGIPAVHTNGFLKLDELGLAGGGEIAAEETCAVGAVAVTDDQRHDHLAGDVAAHDQHVGLVEFRGVEKLQETFLRAVNIARVKDLEVLTHRAQAPEN